MQFGVTVGQAAPWPELVATWTFLDRETKFHSAWLFDHFVAGQPEDTNPDACFDGWAALAALAALTQRIRLGVLVSGITYRNPALLARMAGTIDHASNGRLEVGVGAAWHDSEHRMYGYDFPSLRERQDRLEEAVQVLRLLMQEGGRVSFEGRYYHLVDAPRNPPPVQRPHPPIVIGGEGERRTLRTLARYGDVMDCGGTPDMMRHKIEVLERHCRDAGRDPVEITRGYRGPIVVCDNPATVERIAGLIASQYGMGTEAVREQMPIGNAQHVRDVVQRYADVGVQRMIMLSQAPWRHDVFRRINDEVVEAFV